MKKTVNNLNIKNLFAITFSTIGLSLFFLVLTDNEIIKQHKVLFTLCLEIVIIILVVKCRQAILYKAYSDLKFDIAKFLIFYISFALFVSFIPIITITFLFQFNIWLEVLIIVVVGLGLSYFLISDRPYFRLNEILPKNLKEILKFYIPLWKSKEFDEFVGKDLIELYLDSQKLVSYIKKSEMKFSDYSFIVFPLAKVYEGVLKKNTGSGKSDKRERLT